MLPERRTRYSELPDCRSIDTVPVDPTNVPWADAVKMNSPEGVREPWPDTPDAPRFIWAVPDAMVYVVPATFTLPLVTESVYPSDSLPVTVNVSVPDAVPLVLRLFGTKYSPELLVMVNVCPTEMLT